jgi:hypothetical protein
MAHGTAQLRQGRRKSCGTYESAKHCDEGPVSNFEDDTSQAATGALHLGKCQTFPSCRDIFVPWAGRRSGRRCLPHLQPAAAALLARLWMTSQAQKGALRRIPIPAGCSREKMRSIYPPSTFLYGRSLSPGSSLPSKHNCTWNTFHCCQGRELEPSKRQQACSRLAPLPSSHPFELPAPPARLCFPSSGAARE